MAKSVESRVKKLMMHGLGCMIELEDPQHRPREGEFLISRDDLQFNALFSIASMAAMTRRPLKIQTTEDITPDKTGRVVHLSIQF